METLELVRQETRISTELKDFADFVRSLEFTFHADHLLLAGLQPEEIDTAIRRAMKICRLNEVDTADHFQTLYVFDETNGNTYCDWRMTRQGFSLAIMNAPHDNEIIAHWLWELAMKS